MELAKTPEERYRKAQEAIRAGLSNKANGQMHVPARFMGKSFENFEGFGKQAQVVRQAMMDGEGIFIHGPIGTGKTHLAVAAMNWYFAEHFALEGFLNRDMVKFLSAPDLFLELKDGFDKGISEQDILQRYESSKLLLVDDLGAEKVTDWSRQVFYTLIDRRYRNVLPTILTSNLGLDEVAEKIDDRIASRIVGMGKVIFLRGTDWRLKQYEEK